MKKGVTNGTIILNEFQRGRIQEHAERNLARDHAGSETCRASRVGNSRRETGGQLPAVESDHDLRKDFPQAHPAFQEGEQTFL